MTPPAKTRFPRSVALDVARELCQALKPLTSRLVVAGSLRRGKSEVGDVEILYVPLTERRPDGLFDFCDVSLADELLDRMLAQGVLSKRLSVVDRAAWGAKNKLAVHVASGMPVDLFRTTDAAWWNYLVLRTGPAESNTRIASEAQLKGYKWTPYDSGFLRLSDGAEVAMESEEQVFAFVGLPYRHPHQR